MDTRADTQNTEAAAALAPLLSRHVHASRSEWVTMVTETLFVSVAFSLFPIIAL